MRSCAANYFLHCCSCVATTISLLHRETSFSCCTAIIASLMACRPTYMPQASNVATIESTQMHINLIFMVSFTSQYLRLPPWQSKAQSFFLLSTVLLVSIAIFHIALLSSSECGRLMSLPLAKLYTSHAGLRKIRIASRAKKAVLLCDCFT